MKIGFVALVFMSLSACNSTGPLATREDKIVHPSYHYDPATKLCFASFPTSRVGNAQRSWTNVPCTSEVKVIAVSQ